MDRVRWTVLTVSRGVGSSPQICRYPHVYCDILLFITSPIVQELRRAVSGVTGYMAQYNTKITLFLVPFPCSLCSFPVPCTLSLCLGPFPCSLYSFPVSWTLSLFLGPFLCSLCYFPFSFDSIPVSLYPFPVP